MSFVVCMLTIAWKRVHSSVEKLWACFKPSDQIKGWCVGWCRGPARNLQPTPGLFHALLCMCGLDAGEMLVNWLPMYHSITLSSLIENSSGAWISTNLVAARFERFAFLWFYYSTSGASILVCRKQALRYHGRTASFWARPLLWIKKKWICEADIGYLVFGRSSVERAPGTGGAGSAGSAGGAHGIAGIAGIAGPMVQWSNGSKFRLHHFGLS